MLEINDLWVGIDDKTILKGVDLEIGEGEIHILFGPNGCGKSTLIKAIMGLKPFAVTEGEIKFRGKVLNELTTDERAKLGIGMAFQRPPEIKGVRLQTFINAIKGKDFDVEENFDKLNLVLHKDRELNLGFSGGEIKRSEILKILAQDPDLILLDEPESGVDLENIALLSEILKELLQKDERIREREKSALIITHSGYILDYMETDRGYVMLDGKIVCQGNPREMFNSIKEKGYEECVRCCKESD
jgi:Fe-S cluster assembly ATP-binding protein